jgi:hypothetical protein
VVLGHYTAEDIQVMAAVPVVPMVAVVLEVLEDTVDQEVLVDLMDLVEVVVVAGLKVVTMLDLAPLIVEAAAEAV